MSKVTIYGFAPSTYTQTALLVAEECGVEVQLAPLEFKQASHFALHPYGKMPVMDDGKVRLHETVAIASYLDAKYGGGKLTPADPVEHARMLQWISIGLDYAYARLVHPFLKEENTAEEIAATAEQLKLLDVGMGEGVFLCGDAPSIADFFLYPMVAYAVQKMGDSEPKGVKKLTRWCKDMSGLKSAQRVLQEKAA